jgi:serine protease Do
MVKRSASLVLALLVAACGGPAASPDTVAVEELCAQDASPAPTERDGDIKRRLEDALAKLAESGASRPLADLESGLERARTDAFAPLAPASDALGAADVHERVRGAVGIVGKRYLCGKCDKWHLSTATGFFVSADGAFVTSRHVIEGLPDTTFGVMTVDGAVHPVVEVLAADDVADVVVLRVAGSGFTALPLRSGIRTGEAVHVLSHPDSAFWYFTSGVVARRYAARPQAGRSVDVLDITADFARGSSGGPVIDATGAVVGVVRATDSVYYVERNDEQSNLQMVFKRSVPVEAVIALTR